MNVSANSFVLSTANFRMQAIASLTGSNQDAVNLFMSAIKGDFFTDNTNTNPWAALMPTKADTGLTANGRNMTLNDPESAYRMMTIINKKDVLYKAQYSELSSMKDGLTAMQQAADALDVSVSTDNDSIKSQLQGFVDGYNGWVKQFSEDMQQGGLLANTQAAQVARHELNQSIKNIFHGAKDGLHGLADIGITIDRVTGLADLNTDKLDKMLASNKQGVADAVEEFAANFAEAAKLLNSDGNFMPRQLDNLSRAIHYIDDNSSSLQVEFGTGDAVKPTGAVAKALAVYNKVYGG